MAGGPANLVIVRAGDGSRHESWLDPTSERDFALAVSYYGDEPERWAPAADRLVAAKGPKWGPLADFIDDEWQWVSQFDYVALPDDDLAASAADWKGFFAAMAEFDLDLAQPALDYASFWTHQITARRPAYRVRLTNFVEVMTPAFSRWALERCLPTFRMSTSGFGLDVVWPAIVQTAGRRLGIVDEVAFGHTRPFNGAAPVEPGEADGGGGLYQLLSHPPLIDEMILSQIFGVTFPFDPVVYSAVPATA
ncbi:MAG: DUF707 domain-containing protein [Acidimicrobiales bacterium]